MVALTETPRLDAHPHGADGDIERARQIAGDVPDPEIPVLTLADLGVVRDVQRRGATIVVALTPTYTGCPATAAIRLAVENALHDAGFRDVATETVLSPAWTTDDISDAGRAKLKAYGIAPPGKGGSPAALFQDEVVACPRCNSTATTKVSEFGSTACKAHWRCDACREPFDYFKCHR